MSTRALLARAGALAGLAACSALVAAAVVNRYAEFATEAVSGHRWVALVMGYRFARLVWAPPAYRSPVEGVYAAGPISEGGLLVEFYPRGAWGSRNQSQLTVWRSRTPDAPGLVARRLRRVFDRGFEGTRGWPPRGNSCVGALWARIESAADPQARLLCQRIPGSTEGALLTKRDDGTWIYLFERLDAGPDASAPVR